MKTENPACIICGDRVRVDKRGVCRRCAPAAYKGLAVGLLLALLASPAEAAPHPAPLYLLTTASVSQDLGFNASQHGAELGGRIPIARHVEAWWAASWATAPKADGGTGEQAAFVFELDRHLGRRWWAGAGIDRVELRTPRYDKGSTGFRVHLSRRAAWGVASVTARTGDGENRPRTIEAAAELAAGRFVFRLAVAGISFDSASGRREGFRVALALGVGLGSAAVAEPRP